MRAPARGALPARAARRDGAPVSPRVAVVCDRGASRLEARAVCAPEVLERLCRAQYGAFRAAAAALSVCSSRRCARRFCVLVALCALFVPTDTVGAPRAKAAICKLARVAYDASACRPTRRELFTRSEPCVWNLSVVSDVIRERHPLVLPADTALSPQQVRLLTRLDGCNSTEQCAGETVDCTYGIEDPTDAFWWREYNHGIKFVVMMKIGFLSLVFYIAAIISDGTIFSPHRPSIASNVASVLILIALSALLYIRLVPRKMQYSLLGGDLFQTTAVLLIILTTAVLLPAMAVIALNFVIFSVTFLWFFVEQCLSVIVGFLQFLAGLSLFNIQHTYLCLRQIYFNGTDAEYEQQLVSNSERFLQQMRNNWFLTKVPRFFLENADLAVRTVLSEHLHDQVDFVPNVDMDSFASEEDEESVLVQSAPEANETTPLLERTSGA
ncbi:hypothetical protein FGB62_1g659 [Gracilaria domingensis]|nr:hypothetical protein FGB62_1g659 [Gracilaria domingensis]